MADSTLRGRALALAVALEPIEEVGERMRAPLTELRDLLRAAAAAAPAELQALLELLDDGSLAESLVRLTGRLCSPKLVGMAHLASGALVAVAALGPPFLAALRAANAFDLFTRSVMSPDVALRDLGVLGLLPLLAVPELLAELAATGGAQCDVLADMLAAGPAAADDVNRDVLTAAEAILSHVYASDDTVRDSGDDADDGGDRASRAGSAAARIAMASGGATLPTRALVGSKPVSRSRASSIALRGSARAADEPTRAAARPAAAAVAGGGASRKPPPLPSFARVGVAAPPQAAPPLASHAARQLQRIARGWLARARLRREGGALREARELRGRAALRERLGELTARLAPPRGGADADRLLRRGAVEALFHFLKGLQPEAEAHVAALASASALPDHLVALCRLEMDAHESHPAALVLATLTNLASLGAAVAIARREGALRALVDALLCDDPPTVYYGTACLQNLMAEPAVLESAALMAALTPAVEPRLLALAAVPNAHMQQVAAGALANIRQSPQRPRPDLAAAPAPKTDARPAATDARPAATDARPAATDARPAVAPADADAEAETDALARAAAAARGMPPTAADRASAAAGRAKKLAREAVALADRASAAAAAAATADDDARRGALRASARELAVRSGDAAGRAAVMARVAERATASARAAQHAAATRLQAVARGRAARRARAEHRVRKAAAERARAHRAREAAARARALHAARAAIRARAARRCASGIQRAACAAALLQAAVRRLGASRELAFVRYTAALDDATAQAAVQLRRGQRRVAAHGRAPASPSSSLPAIILETEPRPRAAAGGAQGSAAAGPARAPAMLVTQAVVPVSFRVMTRHELTVF